MLEVLHVGVCAGIEPADVAVVLPPDHEGRPAVLAEHLDDLAVVLGFAGVVGADHEPIARTGAQHGAWVGHGRMIRVAPLARIRAGDGS